MDVVTQVVREQRRRAITDLLEREGAVLEAWQARLAGMEPPWRAAFASLLDAYQTFIHTGVTTQDGYLISRQIFGLAQNQFEKVSAAMLASIFPPQPIDMRGSLFMTEPAHFQEATSSFKENGYHVFQEKLSPEFIERLKAQILLCPVVDDQDKPVASMLGDAPINYQRLNIQEKHIIKIPEVRQIVQDPFLVGVAQAYLGCQPVFDGVRVCKTFPRPSYGGFVSRGDASQAYHADKNGLTFMKFFVYLSDVDNNCGPHCYVAGTHGPWPSQWRRDQRISDDEVAQHIDSSRIRYVCGPAGTVLCADVAGMHKGITPLVGPRTLIEISFFSSIFGSYNGLHSQKSCAVDYDIDGDGKEHFNGLSRYGARMVSRYLLQYL